MFRLMKLESFHQENLGLFRRIILKLTLSIYSFSVCTVLAEDSCEQCIETFGFHKIHLMYWIPEDYQEGKNSR
jgi:hypothetical protein